MHLEESVAKQQICQVKPIFPVDNDGTLREELEIEIQSINRNPKGNYHPKVVQELLWQPHKMRVPITKVQWITYVKKFVQTNPDIPWEYYGKWMDMLNRMEGDQDERLVKGLANSSSTFSIPEQVRGEMERPRERIVDGSKENERNVVTLKSREGGRDRKEERTS